MADQILTSEAGRRMLNMVSPIYERSDTAKWLMESMGREIDALKELVTSFSAQISPRTATWSLTIWEEKYGLKAKAGEAMENRRAKVLSRMASPGAFTPHKVKALAEALTGASARIAENESPYAFTLYLSAETGEENGLIRELNRIKPAHMSFFIEHEKSVNGQAYFACAEARGIYIEIRQAN